MALDVLRATAESLQHDLEKGTLTSVDIVTAYLAQIRAHNHQGLCLRAIVATAPEQCLQAAAKLDAERAEGKIRSRLHGVPIVLKDAFATSRATGLPTTAGAVAFEGTFANEDAEVIPKLREAGLIILGKASMTEFCGLKASMMTAGWSASNGQTQSAWIEGGYKPDDLFMGRSTPGGSSSGSAVAVSAGFAPLALGTETSGSICMPANRAGIYAMKITHETAPAKGIFPLSKGFDGIGGMARSATDLASLIEVMCQVKYEEPTAVGFVDPRIWDAMSFQRTRETDVEDQIISWYHYFRSFCQQFMTCVFPIDVPSTKDMWYEGKSVLHSTSSRLTYKKVFYFQELFAKFCSTLEEPRVTTVQELIEFNKQHVTRAMPEPHTDQTDLEATLDSPMTEIDAQKASEFGRTSARRAIDNALQQYDIDLIAGPGDCSLCVLAALAGYPSAVVPLHELQGPEGMGQPQGIMIIGTQGSEGKLLNFMKLWEQQKHGPAKVPVLLT